MESEQIIFCDSCGSRNVQTGPTNQEAGVEPVSMNSLAFAPNVHATPAVHFEHQWKAVCFSCGYVVTWMK